MEVSGRLHEFAAFRAAEFGGICGKAFHDSADCQGVQGAEKVHKRSISSFVKMSFHVYRLSTGRPTQSAAFCIV